MGHKTLNMLKYAYIYFYADFILNQEMWLFVLLDMADVHCLLSWACILFFNLSWGVSLACKRMEEHTSHIRNSSYIPQTEQHSHIWPPVAIADGYSGLVPIPRLSSLGTRLPACLLKCQDCESMGMDRPCSWSLQLKKADQQSCSTQEYKVH